MIRHPTPVPHPHGVGSEGQLSPAPNTERSGLDGPWKGLFPEWRADRSAVHVCFVFHDQYFFMINFLMIIRYGVLGILDLDPTVLGDVPV